MAKKSDNVPMATTAVSSPLRGANQDQSGTGVKNDTGDYTISDEKKTRLGAIKKAVSEKVRDSWEDNTPAQRKRYVKDLLKLSTRHGAVEMPHEKIKEEVEQIDEKEVVFTGSPQHTAKKAAEHKKMGYKVVSMKKHTSGSFGDNSEKHTYKMAKEEVEIEEAAPKWDEKEFKLVRPGTWKHTSGSSIHYGNGSKSYRVMHGNESDPKKYSTLDGAQKAVRAKHVNEEVEQVDEISKDLATRYKDKVMYMPAADQDKESSHKKIKRLIGAARAIGKVRGSDNIKVPATEETIDEIVSAMGSVRSTPVNIKTSGHSGTTDSPKNANAMQHAADSRRAALDKQAQQAKEKAKTDAEKQIKDREAEQKRRDAERNKALKTSQESPMKEEIELIEGRPKKGAATSEDPGSEHIVMQLRKSISLRGQHPVKFVNGQTAKVSPTTAHKALAHHDNLRTSAEKDEFAKRLHHSPESMHDAMSGKPAPKKAKVSLAGKITGTQS